MNTRNNYKIFSWKNVMLMTVICGLSILYVSQHIVITRMGFQIRQEEMRLEKLLDEKARLMSVVSSLESPTHIQKMIADTNLNLELSKKPRVVKVKL